MTDISFEQRVIAEIHALRLTLQLALGKIAILDGDGDKELERLRGLVTGNLKNNGITINGGRDSLAEAYAEEAVNKLFDTVRTRVPKTPD